MSESPTTTRHEADQDHAPVREDPGLDSVEKGVGFNFTKNDQRATVHAELSGIVRRLLAHDYFDLDRCRVLVDGGRVEYRETVPGRGEGVAIVAVTGTLPVAVLKARPSPRQTGTHADIITEEVYRRRATDGGRTRRVETPERRPSNDAPDTRDLAERLDVDGETLRYYGERHPSLTPDLLAEWAGVELDDDLREDVAAWIAAVHPGGDRE